jgi:3-phosphoshikimate 1-carboxyvinyltransferase
MVAASIVKGSEVRIRCVGLNPTRSGVFDALIQMGADIECEAIDSGSAEAVCDLVVRYRGLKGVDIEGDLALRCIDELPVLAVAGAFASGVTRIKDAAELRVKESDRIAMTAGGLRQLGFTVSEFDDGLQVVGGDTTSAATIDADGDHRIAMSFAVAGLAGRHSVTLRGAESVLTSYPNFFHHLEELSHVRAD